MPSLYTSSDLASAVTAVQNGQSVRPSSQGSSFILADDGSITVGGDQDDSGSGSSGGNIPTTTNVSVWMPSDQTAFEKARNARIFTRIGTRQSQAQLQKAVEAESSQLNQSFCLLVNNVVLVFSATKEEHVSQVRSVLEMLQRNSMSADIHDCVFDAATSVDAGVQLDQVGNHSTFMVINLGVPMK